MRFASCFGFCIARHGGQCGQETNIRSASDSNGYFVTLQLHFAKK